MFCPVCQSSPVFPVQLKCDHILCYLCLKGVFNTTQKCPLCIRSIDCNLVKRPKFVTNDVHSDRPDFSGMQWFYEGRPGSGFWAYDHSNSQLLEQSFTTDHKNCEITISGVEYYVDFVQRIQYHKDFPSKKRNVRRDLLSNISVFKGIAGVSKYLIPEMLRPLGSNSPRSDSSGQQMPSNSSGEDNSGSDEHIRKKIKVEIKREPDSTSD